MPRSSILSIQSHVVHGIVGNKAATLPLQLLGFDVDPLNTVHFSNHTGYPYFKGQKLLQSDFLDIISGLEANELLIYSHVLTGYVGTLDTLEEIYIFTKSLKEKNHKLFVTVDPVMGDNNVLYVDRSFIDLYRNKLLKIADMIVPNWFETE